MKTNSYLIPRLVGPQCKQYEENNGEDYACWHTALFGLARCPGPQGCCDVLMFKSQLMRRSSDVQEYRFAPTWRARLAELKLLNNKALDKLNEAKRIGCIADTSLLKQWFPTRPETIAGSAAEPRAASGPPDCLERLTIMNMFLTKFDSWPGEIFHRVCALVGIAPGCHSSQRNGCLFNRLSIPPCLRIAAGSLMSWWVVGLVGFVVIVV